MSKVGSQRFNNVILNFETNSKNVCHTLLPQEPGYTIYSSVYSVLNCFQNEIWGLGSVLHGSGFWIMTII